jgi:hypothetical protein
MSLSDKHPTAAAWLATTLLLMPSFGAAMDRAACAQQHQARSGQSGKDVIWLPTEDDVVATMLRLASIQPTDHVIDLGSGDGRIVIESARRYGVKAVGVEYNPELVKLSQCFAAADGVADKVTFIQGDIFETDFSSATVLMMYLLPDLNLRLMPTILKMKPGTRVVSHSFLMGDWQPEDRVVGDIHNAYLWIVPADVRGNWSFKGPDGAAAFTMSLAQEFQRVTGSVAINGTEAGIEGSKLQGATLSLSFRDADRAERRLTGTVDGGRIMATVTGPQGPRQYIGTRS